MATFETSGDQFSFKKESNSLLLLVKTDLCHPILGPESSGLAAKPVDPGLAINFLNKQRVECEAISKKISRSTASYLAFNYPNSISVSLLLILI